MGDRDVDSDPDLVGVLERAGVLETDGVMLAESVGSWDGGATLGEATMADEVDDSEEDSDIDALCVTELLTVALGVFDVDAVSDPVDVAESEADVESVEDTVPVADKDSELVSETAGVVDADA